MAARWGFDGVAPYPYTDRRAPRWRKLRDWRRGQAKRIHQERRTK